MAQSGGMSMPWDTIVKLGTSLTAGIVGASGSKKNTRKLNKLISNAPKYKINDEAFENQNIARSQAFGRDRSIQMQQENVSQEAANSAGQARDISSSTSSLLSAISSINSSKNQTLRGLAQDESAIQNDKIQQLYGVNNMMIDEKDKRWNYNTNMPFQNKVAALRDKVKYNQDLQLGAAS